jgi:putative endonuclease
MARSHDFGRACEHLAARYLEERGWRILERNYRCGHREIDLIARREDCVAFVEVKGRHAAWQGDALEAITWRKRREIERVARQWLARFGRPGLTCRFDAIAVRVGHAGQREIEHVPDAWRICG